MAWDGVLVGFIDLMLSKHDDFKEDFFVTADELVSLTGLCHQSVSSNLRVCVKNGYLIKKEQFTNGGRVVRYYIKDRAILDFVNKFLRD